MNIGPVQRARTLAGGSQVRGVASNRPAIEGVGKLDELSRLLDDASDWPSPEGDAGALRPADPQQLASADPRLMMKNRGRQRPEEAIGALVDDGVTELIDEVSSRVDQLLASESLSPDVKSNLGDALVVFEGLMRRAQTSFLGSDKRSVSELARQLQDALSRLLSTVPDGAEHADDVAVRLSSFASEISMLFVSAVARMTDEIVSSAIEPALPPAETSGKAYDRFLSGYRTPPEGHAGLDLQS